jgi:cytokinin dehydrogenase
METRLGRRNFLVGMAAGTAILAFDPCNHAWITVGHADHADGIPIPDLDQYVADQNVVVMDERFSYLEGQVVPAPRGGRMFMLEAASYYTPPQEPDNPALLHGLSPDAGTMIQEFTYFDWQNRLAPVVIALRRSGVWFFPHPWFNVFLPGADWPRFLRQRARDDPRQM